MSRIGARLAGRFAITHLLGGGGQGAVYAAHDDELGRTVAVKMLSSTAGPEQLARFRREARVLAMIKHPNVVAVFDIGWHEGDAFVVMEHLTGRNLAEIQYELERVPIGQVLDYAVPIADALTHLHGHRTPVIHRDLKPQNIVLDGDGTVKICDFGLAVAPDAQLSRVTLPGALMGTPAYMSPEQCLGKDPGTASDVYSFGAVLYTLLTGGPPFGTKGVPQELAERVIHEKPEPVSVRCPDAPPRLVAIVHSILAKDPAARPTAQRVRDLLASLMPPVPRGLAPTLPDPLPSTVPGTAHEPADLLAERNLVTGVPATSTHTGRESGSTLANPDYGFGRELEAGELLLRQGFYTRADQYFADLAHRLRAEPDADEAQRFAAEFGRVRSKFGLGEEAVGAVRLVRLATRAEAALGHDHPLVREIRAYLDAQSG